MPTKGPCDSWWNSKEKGEEKKYDLDKLHGSFHINSLFNWHIMEILTVIAD